MEVYNRFDPEVSSQVIGELVMERLKKLDEVAYVRFASVHAIPRYTNSHGRARKAPE